MIIKASELNVDDITYSSLKVLDNGAKLIWIANKGAPLIMQLPKMSAPFGVSRWADDKTEKYSLDLSFKGRETDENIQKAYDMFMALDKKIIRDAMENSPAWFKKKIASIDVMEALYHPIVRQPKDDKYAPTIKLPLAYADNAFKCLAFDASKKVVNLADVNLKGAEVVSIVQCTGIWIAGGGAGCSWKVNQLKVFPKPSLNTYAFQDDDDDAVADADDADAVGERSTGAQGSDDDDLDI